MKTHTTPSGIELLMPQVPRYATNISFQQAKGVGNIKYRLLYRTRIKWTRYRWMYVNDKELSILGTCWREGGKLICEGFDPRDFVKTIFVEIAPSPSNDMQGDYDIRWTDYMNQGEYAGYGGDAGCFYSVFDSFDSWLRSEGITIDEGFKRVIIKVN